MPEPRPRILLIDDDVDLRDSLAEALEQSGYQVTRANNGQQGLQALSGDLPDLILLDLLMPVMNGWQFCRAQKEDPRAARVPVIVMSAAVSKDPRSPYYIDVHDFVAKPLEIEDLLTKISGALGRPDHGGPPAPPPEHNL